MLQDNGMLPIFFFEHFYAGRTEFSVSVLITVRVIIAIIDCLL